MLRTFTQFSVISSLLFIGSLTAQLRAQGTIYEIDEHFTIVDCEGTFLDDGGPMMPHDPTGVEEITICSNSTDPNSTHISLNFSQVAIAGTMEIYDDSFVNPGMLIATLTDADNGTTPVISASIANPSGCLTIRFTPNGSNVGWNAFIRCIKACQSVVASISDSTPEIMPADTGTIDICPGDRVFFTGTGIYAQDGLVYDQDDATSTFEWNFNDGTTAMGNNVSQVFEEPGGYLVQLTVTDTEGCSSLNQINQRIRVSPGPIVTFQENLEDNYCVGETIDLTQSTELDPDATTNLFIETEPISYPVSLTFADTIPLPDGNGASYLSPLEFTGFNPGQTLSDGDEIVAVCLNIEHSYAGDLEIELICGDPSGTNQSIILLPFPNGMNGTYLGDPIDNDATLTPGVGFDYCITNDGGLTLSMAEDTLPAIEPSMIPGDYLPEESFDGMIGCPLNGEWYIRISDNLNIDDGWLFSWSLEFEETLYPDRDSFEVGIDSVFWQDNPDLIYYSSDSIVTTPTAAGASDYILTVVDSFGCVWDTAVVANMLPFSHPDCYDCLPMLDETLQQDTICDQGSIQTTLATIEQIDTAILWQSYENVPFGQPQFPDLANALQSHIDVNSISPTILTNINQIESICMNIETDFASDIGLFLRAPDGSLLELSTGNGAGGNNYTNTCFSPTATDPITAGAPPFTGTYQPEGNWNNLIGTLINGRWSLLAFDNTGIQVGTFVDWTITFVHTIEINHTWTPDDGNLSCTDCPDPIITTDQTQTYQLEVVDDYGCTETGEVQIVVVSELPPLVLNCNPDAGIGEVIFSWNPSSPSGQYEYTFDTGSGLMGPITVSDTFVTIDNLSNLDEVIFNVRPLVTDPAQLGCVDNSFVSTMCTYIGCQLAANVQSTTNISCFGANDGTATVLIADNDGLLSLLLNNNPITITDNMITGLEPGLYQLIATDPTTCADTVNFTINEPAEVTANISSSDIACNGNQTGFIDVAGSGGTGVLQYALNGNPLQPSGMFTDLPSDTYTVAVQDFNGCTFDSTITLTEPDPIEVMVDASDTQCDDTQDGSISLTVGGGVPGYTYDWADIPGTDDGGDRSLLSPGLYQLTITDDNDCTFTLEETIVAPDPIDLALVSIDSVDCFGGGNGAININPSGGTGQLNFLWDDPNAQVDASAVFLTVGTYTLTATDENNCTSTATYEIEQPDPLDLSFDRENILCRDESTGTATAMTTGGNGGYMYMWETNQMGPTLTGVPAGTYTVTTTDVKGCTIIDSVQLTQPATAVSASIEQDVQGCFGESLNVATVTPAGGTGNYTYLWSNDDDGPTARDLPEGEATVTVTDDSGCSFETSISLEDLEEITFNLITMMPSCNGSSDGGMGVNQLMGGAGMADTDYTFQWSNGTNGIATENLLGGETYSVVVTDQQGCQGTRELFLPDPDPITFETFTDDVSCFGLNDGEAGINNINGPNVGVFSITWSDNTGGSTNPNVTDLAAGTYSVQVMDSRGCTQNANLVIQQPSAIVGDLTTRDATCFGDADGQIIANISGGTPGYSYDWSAAGNGPSIDNIPAGDYELIVRDANDCAFTIQATIEQPAEVTADAQPQDVICAGDATGRILAIGGGGRPPFTYSLDGQFYSRSEQFLGLTSGEYTIFVRDEGGCVRTTTATVADGPAFNLDLGIDTTIVFGDSVLLEANVQGGVGALSYFWQGSYSGTLSCDTCPSVIVSPEFEIDYELLALDENGCEAEDRIRVRVQKIKVVEVPTGFTPNGDNRNDRLLVHGRPGTRVNMFRIFDRWGEVVFEDGDFEVNDTNRGWDGTYRGQDMNGDVFVWQVEVTYEDDTIELLEGQTTLIR